MCTALPVRECYDVSRHVGNNLLYQTESCVVHFPQPKFDQIKNIMHSNDHMEGYYAGGGGGGHSIMFMGKLFRGARTKIPTAQL